MSNETINVNPVAAGVHLAGEYVIPGGSNLVKGDFKQAAIHFGLGLLARAALGPIGLLLVSANSLSVAMTNKNLAQNIDLGGAASTTAVEPPSPPASSRK
jgi:hypothetical protein